MGDDPMRTGRACSEVAVLYRLENDYVGVTFKINEGLRVDRQCEIRAEAFCAHARHCGTAALQASQNAELNWISAKVPDGRPLTRLVLLPSAPDGQWKYIPDQSRLSSPIWGPLARFQIWRRLVPNLVIWRHSYGQLRLSSGTCSSGWRQYCPKSPLRTALSSFVPLRWMALYVARQSPATTLSPKGHARAVLSRNGLQTPPLPRMRPP